jgi:cytoskeletal protein CcmA (bactofilin family)
MTDNNIGPNKPIAGSPGNIEEPEQKARKGFLGRLGISFQEAVESSRGTEQAGPDLSLDDTRSGGGDLAPRRAKDSSPKRMVIPEGAVITGSVSSNAETEICGRVNGDVTVEGRLYVGPTGVVAGNVRAGSCKLEGLVEGKMECSQELELTRTGRLNSDTAAGRKITVAGQICGAVSTAGAVRIVNSGKIEGNVQAKQIFIEEGAKFNGRCTMRAAADKRAPVKQ